MTKQSGARDFDNYHPFATVREASPHGEVLHVFGDVDQTTTEELETAIDEAAAGGATVIVNFARCRYLDSSGLTVLLRAHKRYGAAFVVLVKPRTVIARVVQITRLDHVLTVITELQPLDGRSEQILLDAG